MGNNSSKWDRQAHYDAMTMAELEAQKTFWEEVLVKHPYPAANEELEFVRLQIAERIGRKQ